MLNYIIQIGYTSSKYCGTFIPGWETNTSPEKQRRTFLSYSRVNKDFAIALAKELKSEGFDVWLDQLDIPLETV